MAWLYPVNSQVLLDIGKYTLAYRLNNGWDIGKALTQEIRR
jgi:hypothetical protein